MRVHNQPAFVLLNRPYSESSWIVELFTKEFGRIALIAKGARRFKSPLKGVLQPFYPLLVSWTGKGEVPTLTGAELLTRDINLIEHELQGDLLICGFYCNELISYLLHRYDPHPDLFTRYQETLANLLLCSSSDEQGQATILRRFEQAVIKETGYELNFQTEARSKAAIQEGQHYLYLPGEGFVKCDKNHKDAIPGSIIGGLKNGSLEDLSNQEISLGKELMRAILRQSLGYHSINSRSLFMRTLNPS